MTQHARSLTCAVAVVLLAAVTLASASVGDPALVITASNASGTKALSIPLSQFSYDPFYSEYFYSQIGVVDLYDGGNYVARVKSLYAIIDDDQTAPLGVAAITLGYSLIAGTSTTSFTVNSASVSMVPIYPTMSAASMSDTFILTDADYSGHAHLAPLDNYAYRTYYGQTGSANEFFFHGSDTVGIIDAVGGGAVVTGGPDNWPPTPGTYESLGIPVDRMRVETGFTATALDEVQVQSTFVIIPEPAAVGLVVVVGLLLHRRR